MKVRETRVVREGFAQVERTEARVRELPEGAPLPAGAVEVAAETPVRGWEPAESEE